MSKNEKILITLLVGIVILISWTNLNSTRNLENRMRQMQNELGSLRSQITHEVNRVSVVVQEMQQESRWWSPGETELIEVGKDEAEVKVSWFLREYQEGSLVTFNYRKSGEGDFTPMEAQQGTDGYFYSTLPVEMEKEPVWYISISRQSSTNSRQSTAENVVEEKYANFNQIRYEYYISVTKDDTTRTGEIRNIDVGNLSYSLFNSLYSHVVLDQDRPVLVTLIEELYNSPYYQIENIYLESRKGNRSVEKWALENADARHGNEKMYEVLAQPEKDYDSLHIVINYNEGVTVEKKIE